MFFHCYRVGGGPKICFFRSEKPPTSRPPGLHPHPSQPTSGCNFRSFTLTPEMCTANLRVFRDSLRDGPGLQNHSGFTSHNEQLEPQKVLVSKWCLPFPFEALFFQVSALRGSMEKLKGFANMHSRWFFIDTQWEFGGCSTDYLTGFFQKSSHLLEKREWHLIIHPNKESKTALLLVTFLGWWKLDPFKR